MTSGDKTNDGGFGVVYFGTGEFGLATLEALIASDIALKLVVTSPDRPAGRGLKVKQSPIEDVAESAAIDTLQPEDVNDPSVIEKISTYNADIGIVIAYRQKISGAMMDVFPHGIINLHSSLLPAYRGAAPVNWAVINGESTTGATVMRINDQWDAGVMLGHVAVEIKQAERADELYDRLAVLGSSLVMETLGRIRKGTTEEIEQDESKASKAPKLKKGDGYIDWRQSAATIANRICGLWPWPASKAVFVPQDGKPVEVGFARARVSASSGQQLQPGVLLDDLTICCGSGRLEIMEIKPAGKKLMSWEAFVNGRHVKPGDRFVSIDMKED